MAKSKKRRPQADRRARFAAEYAKDCNATQAAIRSGYSKKTARAQGSRLLTRVDIAADVERRLQNAMAVGDITVERTAREIARIAYGDMRNLYDGEGRLKPPSEWDDDTAATVASMESEELFEMVGSGKDRERAHRGNLLKVKRWDKSRALDMCMSYLGMHKTGKAPPEGGGLSLTIKTSQGAKLR